MMQTRFPYVLTHEETAQVVHNCRNPHLRVGQAVANSYRLPKPIEDLIWEDNDFQSVVNKLFDNFIKEEYQNVSQ